MATLVIASALTTSVQAQPAASVCGRHMHLWPALYSKARNTQVRHTAFRLNFGAALLQTALLRCVQITMEELNVIDKLPHYCPVCAYHEWNLDGLVDMIWDYIDVLRIYTKPKVT